MPAHALIPELETIAAKPEAHCDAALRKLADLFTHGAPRFAKAHVDLFDGVFTGLVPRSPIGARAHLAQRMAPLANAPPNVIGTLAHDDEIAVAGPVLSHSPVIDEPTLVKVATSKGQRHLQAISIRATVTQAVTDIIVRRGDHQVVRLIARNAGARFSHAGFCTMIHRAGEDGDLAVSVSHRDDLADAHLADLVTKSAERVRQQMVEAAAPDRKAAIVRAMRAIADAPKPSAERDFAPAQRTVLTLHRAQRLNEASLLGFAQANDYETCVAVLSALSGVGIITVDQFMASDTTDPVVLLCKAVGLNWRCARALLLVRQSSKLSPADVESARLTYEQLVPETARRMVTLWRSRGSARAGH